MSNQPLPELPFVAAQDAAKRLQPPSLRIRTDDDVLAWKRTRGYQNYMLFLRRLNEAVVGHFLPFEGEPRGAAVDAMIKLLDQLDSWIDEIPPLPTPQRFGNLAFRTWGKRLEDNADELLDKLLPDPFKGCVRLLKPYLLISFGSFKRMDYGTGHEEAFGLLLLCLTLIRFFQPEPQEERHMVLTVFERYLRLCWKLQDVYNLEPAGSHGVWGLDDSHFLGYIFGSGQLRDQGKIPVNVVLRPSLPPTNLYFLSISRIHSVKQGPFHEHSSQLHSIAVGVPNWGKVNSGLFKMYEAEVLGKRVVVQHTPVGGLLEWNVEETHAQCVPSSQSATETIATYAPWASPSSMPRSTQSNTVPVLPPMPASATTAAPWTTSRTSNRVVDRSLLPPPGPSSITRTVHPSTGPALSDTLVPQFWLPPTNLPRPREGSASSDDTVMQQPSGNANDTQTK